MLRNKDHDLVLSAAPSWQCGDEGAKTEEGKKLAYAAAFYNYSALFEHALTQLKENPGNEIHICPTAIGCGAFSNDAPSVFKAFNKAANNFYQELDDEKKARVKVEMQIFDGRKPLTGIENLGIKEYPDNWKATDTKIVNILAAETPTITLAVIKNVEIQKTIVRAYQKGTFNDFHFHKSLKL